MPTSIIGWPIPQPIAFDAIVLTLLGYLDLGIAEVLDRFERTIYARPTRYFLARFAAIAADSVDGNRGPG